MISYSSAYQALSEKRFYSKMKEFAPLGGREEILSFKSKLVFRKQTKQLTPQKVYEFRIISPAAC